ncbi:MAG: NlpC/P60 family protein [Polyangiaceae bacterium]|nr:NlpC/P60 family protein [Polyangiaceae bacterium]
MATLQSFINYMVNMCNDNSYGYKFGGWGPKDYDCASSIITSLKNTGFAVGGATYTGNMSANLTAHGWQRINSGTINLSSSASLKAGDILLNEADHTALYVGNNQLAEFSSDYDGKSGDSSGKEAWVHGYYNFPWNCILRYNTTVDQTVINFYYSVRAGGTVYPEVHNLADFAGVQGKSITDVAIRVDKGTVKYRVHVMGSGWLPYVTGCNWKDGNNGYAGDAKVIDAIEVNYTPPSGVKQRAQYRVSPVNGNYYPWQYNAEKTNGQDGYAGAIGHPMDRFQLQGCT